MLAQDIKDAELILIGIGNEMQVKLQTLNEIPDFQKKIHELEEQKREWLRPFLIRYYLKKEFHADIVKAYDQLRNMIEGRNYFIVSLSTDDLLRDIGFREDRMVFPCGTYHLLQCEKNCCGKLFSIEEDLWENICDWVEGREFLEDLAEPVCPDCGAPLVMNQYGQTAYNESGYLENWKKYTRWLQGTVNRKLCILELGVGMEFPSVIRWPFEKICFYNQKSVFWRVHSSLYQLSEEIKMRGKSIREDPVIFLKEIMKNDIGGIEDGFR